MTPAALTHTAWATLTAAIAAVAVAGCGAAGRTTPATPLTTTTAASSPAYLAELLTPLQRYRTYTEAALTEVRAQLQALHAALAGSDRTGAERAWTAAHLAWLRIGQDDGAYGAFAAAGDRIDGISDGETGGLPASGFHRVEADLCRRRDLAAARADTAALITAVDRLGRRAVDADLGYSLAHLDSWMLRGHEILEDALRDTLSGRDDFGSHTAIADITADVAATREQLILLGPYVSERAPHLVATASGELAAIDHTAARLHPTPSGPALSALPARARETLDGQVSAALETLAPVPELLQDGS